MDQAFPPVFAVLQPIKIWTVGRPGNEERFDINHMVNWTIPYLFVFLLTETLDGGKVRKLEYWLQLNFSLSPL